jgi:ABC-type Fe3+ transport system substrate-binding protein
MAGIAVVVALIVAGVGGYYAGTSGATTSTVTNTVTNTVTGGAGSTATVTSTVTATGSAAPSADLVTQAQAECANVSTCLTIYTTFDTSTYAQSFFPTFYAAYPWANGKVNVLALSSQVTTRSISEYKAGNVQADIVQGSMGLFMPILLAGAVQNWTNPAPKLNNFTTGTYDPEGAWTANNLAFANVAYNVKLLPTSQVPKNGSTPLQLAQFLASPAMNGKMEFQKPYNLGTTATFMYYLYTVMGNSSGQWTSLLKQIAANNPISASADSQTASDMEAGRAQVGIMNLNDIVAGEAQGLRPIFSNPIIFSPSVSGITKGAPHPAMAQLMIEWLDSAPGQYALALSGRAPVYIPLAVYSGLVRKGYAEANAYANPLIWKNSGAWADYYKSIMGT